MLKFIKNLFKRSKNKKSLDLMYDELALLCDEYPEYVPNIKDAIFGLRGSVQRYISYKEYTEKNPPIIYSYAVSKDVEDKEPINLSDTILDIESTMSKMSKQDLQEWFDKNEKDLIEKNSVKSFKILSLKDKFL